GVGTRGGTRGTGVGEGEDGTTVIEAESGAARAQGFCTIDPDPERQVIVACDTTGFEPDEIVGMSRMLEELCNECLGWTGNGYCDGPAYGGRSLSVYCPVIDRDLAVEAGVAELRRHGCDNWQERLTVSARGAPGRRR